MVHDRASNFTETSQERKILYYNAGGIHVSCTGKGSNVSFLYPEKGEKNCMYEWIKPLVLYGSSLESGILTQYATCNEQHQRDENPGCNHFLRRREIFNVVFLSLQYPFENTRQPSRNT